MRTRSRYQDPLVRGTRSTRVEAFNLDIVHDDFGSVGNSYVYEVCTDATMPRPYTTDHPLSLEKTVVRPTILNGQIEADAGSFYGPERYQNYRFHPFSANVSLYEFAPFNPDYYKTMALANASPYRSYVNLPLFLFELRELPGMLQQLGRILQRKIRATDVAGGYLAYSFGWAPLVSDLKKLFDFTKKIEDRKAYFRRLESGTHVRRSLGTQTVQVSTPMKATLTRMVGSDPAIEVEAQLEETQKVWYTLNAKLRTPLSMSQSDLHSLSRNQVLGLRINPADIWDAIPWSWLIDYFVNIGDVLEASRAVIGMDITRINVMCLSKQVVVFQPKYVHTGLTCQPGFVYRTKKARYPFSNATPAVTTTPFFTDHMAAILGSLVTVRALKARGFK